jgi:hypothetical protein
MLVVWKLSFLIYLGLKKWLYCVIVMLKMIGRDIYPLMHKISNGLFDSGPCGHDYCWCPIIMIVNFSIQLFCVGLSESLGV